MNKKPEVNMLKNIALALAVSLVPATAFASPAATAVDDHKKDEHKDEHKKDEHKDDKDHKDEHHDDHHEDHKDDDHKAKPKH